MANANLPFAKFQAPTSDSNINVERQSQNIKRSSHCKWTTVFSLSRSGNRWRIFKTGSHVNSPLVECRRSHPKSQTKRWGTQSKLEAPYSLKFSKAKVIQFAIFVLDSPAAPAAAEQNVVSFTLSVDKATNLELGVPIHEFRRRLKASSFPSAPPSSAAKSSLRAMREGIWIEFARTVQLCLHASARDGPILCSQLLHVTSRPERKSAILYSSQPLLFSAAYVLTPATFKTLKQVQRARLIICRERGLLRLCASCRITS